MLSTKSSVDFEFSHLIILYLIVRQGVDLTIRLHIPCWSMRRCFHHANLVSAGSAA